MGVSNWVWVSLCVGVSGRMCLSGCLFSVCFSLGVCLAVFLPFSGCGHFSMVLKSLWHFPGVSLSSCATSPGIWLPLWVWASLSLV